MKKSREIQNSKLSAPSSQLLTGLSEQRVEIFTGVILFAFGVYHSVLYFGHTIVPNGDFLDLFGIGKDLLSLKLPATFKKAPVLGLLQNFLCPIAWGTSPRLTAGWLLNAILHPFSVVLLWLIGRKIVGRAAVWIALIVAINPWTIYLLTEPIVETALLFFVLLTFFLILRRSRWAYLAASVTTMIRYEGAALIMVAFVADIIHKKDRRDVAKAFVFSAIASAPFILWMLLTVVNWRNESGAHYLDILFSKEYAKSFTGGQGQKGILLHLQILWQEAFRPLLIPFPGAGEDFAETMLKLSEMTIVVGFVTGCLFAFFRRRWEVLILLLFLLPYFVLHAYYPYPFTRFYSTVSWIVILIVLFGLQGARFFLAGKAPIPRAAASLLKGIAAITAAAWCISLVLYFSQAASISPVSVSMPYVSMLLVALILGVRLLSSRPPRLVGIPGTFCLAGILCLLIASNQFNLASLLGDGKKEIEFKMLGEWFAANGRDGEKMAVYNDGPAALYAGKLAAGITGFPKADSPEEFVEKLYQNNITYVVWATREGIGQRHTDYRFSKLDTNLAMLEKPRDIGPYQFVTQAGTDRGYVNIFRLKNTGKH